MHTVLIVHCSHCTLFSLYNVLTYTFLIVHCSHCTMFSLYTVLTVHCSHCTLFSLYTVLIVQCSNCTLFSLYTVLIVHCSNCTLFSLYTVLIVHCSQCKLFSLYTVLAVHCSHQCNSVSKISHTNNRPLSFLLQPLYDVEFLDIKSTTSTKEYVDPVEVLIEKDGSKSTVTVKATLKKELPQVATVSMSTR